MIQEKEIELIYKKNDDTTKITSISAGDTNVLLKKIIDIFYEPFDLWIPYTGDIVYYEDQLPAPAPGLWVMGGGITYKEASKQYINKKDLESILTRLFQDWKNCNYEYKIKIESDKDKYVNIILKWTDTSLNAIVDATRYIDDNLCTWTIKHNNFLTFEYLINFKKGKELSSWYPKWSRDDLIERGLI